MDENSLGETVERLHSDAVLNSLHRRRVLVVEDHQDTARLYHELLTDAGFEVLLASSVPEAIKALRSRPDFCIVDLMLPGARGDEFLRYLRMDHDGYYTTTGRGQMVPLELTAAVVGSAIRDPKIISYISRGGFPFVEKEAVKDKIENAPSQERYADISKKVNTFFRRLFGNYLLPQDVERQTQPVERQILGHDLDEKKIHDKLSMLNDLVGHAERGVIKTAANRLSVLDSLGTFHLGRLDDQPSGPFELTGRLGRNLKIAHMIPTSSAHYRISAGEGGVGPISVFSLEDRIPPNLITFVSKPVGPRKVVGRMHEAWMTAINISEPFPYPTYFYENGKGICWVANSFLAGIPGHYFFPMLDYLVSRGRVPHDEATSIREAYLKVALKRAWAYDRELRNPTRRTGYIDGIDWSRINDTRVPFEASHDASFAAIRDLQHNYYTPKARFVFTDLAGLSEQDERFAVFSRNKDIVLRSYDEFSGSIYPDIERAKKVINIKRDDMPPNAVILEDYVLPNEETFIAIINKLRAIGYEQAFDERLGFYERGPELKVAFRTEDDINKIMAPEMGYEGSGLPRARQVDLLVAEIEQLGREHPHLFNEINLSRRWGAYAESGHYKAARKAQLEDRDYSQRYGQERLTRDAKYNAQMAIFRRQRNSWLKSMVWSAELEDVYFEVIGRQSISRPVTYHHIEDRVRELLTEGREEEYLERMKAKPMPSDIKTLQDRSLAKLHFALELINYVKEREARPDIVPRVA